MELINNIWSTLNTPSIVNTMIFSLPLAFIEFYLFMKIFLVFLDIKSSKKQQLLYTFLAGTFTILSKLFLPAPYNVFLNYLLLFLVAKIVFHITTLKAFIGTVISFATYSIISALILNPFLTLLHISSETLSTTPIYTIGYSITLYLFFFLTICILKLTKFKITFFNDISLKNKRIITLNFIFAIITLAIQSFIEGYYIDNIPIFITFLSFLSLISYLGISIFSLTKTINLSETTKKLQTAEEYNKTLKILHDNVRGFKHDFDNIVTTIGGYVKTNDMDGLRKYYLQLEGDCQKVSNLYILNPEIINNPGIYNLLTTKYREADSKNIKVNMSLLLDLNDLKMKIYEFARILGILLDNAIEASEECDNKIINIVFRDDFRKHRQLISIENTYKNKNVDTVKIFGKGVSEKENHTGLGLWEVNKILKSNTNVSIFTTKSDKYFCQQLEIYY